MYHCVYQSCFIDHVASPYLSDNRHLRVPANDVLEAIEHLKQQMERENQQVVKVIAVAPASLLPY